MLFVRHDEEGCHPVVRCHVWNKNVVDTGRAVVVYPQSVEPDQTYRVAIAHNGGCQDVLVKTLANDLGPARTLNLDEYLDRLQDSRKIEC